MAARKTTSPRLPGEGTVSVGGLARRTLLAALAATILALLWVPLRTIPVGIENRAQLEVFSMDEPALVVRVDRHLRERSLDPHGNFNYGALYPTLGAGTLGLLQILGLEPTEARIAWVMRMLSWTSFVVLLALVAWTLRGLGASIEATLLAVLLVAAGKDLHYWAQHIHPDVLQSAILTLAFGVAIRGTGWTRAVVAAGLTGLAFGTKYSGAFAAPFVIAPAVSGTWAAVGLSWRRRTLHVARGVGLSISAFGVGWLAFNPYVLSSFGEFRADLAFERTHIGFGHYVAEPRNPLLWFEVFRRDLGPVHWLVALGLGLAVVALVSRARGSGAGAWGSDAWARGNDARARGSAHARSSLPLWLLLAYVCVSFAFLAGAVNMRRMRYALHFWPLLMVLVGWGLDQGLAWMRGRGGTHPASSPTAQGGADRPGRLARVSLVAVAVAAVLSAVWAGVDTAREGAALTRRMAHPTFAAAEWMVQQYKPGTPVLADAYVYRHPHFQNLVTVLGVRPHDVVEHAPYLVVLMERMSGRFSWKAPGTRFAERDFVLGPGQGAEGIQQFHRELFAPTSPYAVVYETDSIVVLELREDGPN